MKFPAYRKYRNNRNFFKITNATAFEEVQVVGSKRFLRKTVARQLPEVQFVNDLLTFYNEIAVEIDEAEYEKERQGVI